MCRRKVIYGSFEADYYTCFRCCRAAQDSQGMHDTGDHSNHFSSPNNGKLFASYNLLDASKISLFNKTHTFIRLCMPVGIVWIRHAVFRTELAIFTADGFDEEFCVEKSCLAHVFICFTSKIFFQIWNCLRLWGEEHGSKWTGSLNWKHSAMSRGCFVASGLSFLCNFFYLFCF